MSQYTLWTYMYFINILKYAPKARKISAYYPAQFQFINIKKKVGSPLRLSIPAIYTTTVFAIEHFGQDD